MSDRSKTIKSIISYGLPYVFTDKVKISKESMIDGDPKKLISNENTKLVELSLFVNDLLNNSLWYNESFSKNLRVRVIQSEHPELTDRIIKEKIKDIKVLEEESRKFLVQKDIVITTNKSLDTYKVHELTDIKDVLCSVPISMKFICSSSHLTYFAFCFLEDDFGDTTIERVLLDDKVTLKSTSYYLSSGKIWAGPVHKTQDGYATGLSNAPKGSEIVDKREHLNIKINDYRVFDKIRKLVNNINLTDPRNTTSKIFSDLHMSRDNDKSVKGLFLVNYHAIVLQHSKYNAILKNYTVEDIYKNSKLDNLKIIRRKEKQHHINSFNTPEDFESYEVIATSFDSLRTTTLKPKSYFKDTNGDKKLDKFIGSVSEKKIRGAGTNRTFTFYDAQVKDFEAGQYQYGVEMILKDPSIRIMQDQIELLTKAKKLIVDYYKFIGQKHHFDNNNKVSNRALNSMKVIYNIDNRVGTPKQTYGEVPWRKSIRILLRVIKNLIGQYDKNIESELIRILSPISRVMSGIEEYIKLIDELIAKLPEKPVQFDFKNQHSVASLSTKEDAIRVSYFFKEKHNSSKVSTYGMNYFDGYLTNNAFGINVITPISLLERFKSKAVKDNVTVPSIANPDQYKSFYSNLNPTSIQAGGNIISFASGSSVVPYLNEAIKIKSLKNKIKPHNSKTDIVQKGISLTNNETDNKKKVYHAYNDLAAIKGLRIEPENQNNPASAIPDKHEKKSFSIGEGRMSAKETDIFNTKKRIKESNPFVENNHFDVALVNDLDLKKSIGILTSPEPEVELEQDTNVLVRYVIGFEKDFTPITVEAPFSSNEPYLIMLNSTNKSKYALSDHMNNGILLVDIAKPVSTIPAAPENTQDDLSEPEPTSTTDEIKGFGDSCDSNVDALFSRESMMNFERV